MGLLKRLAERIRLRLLVRQEYESLSLRRWFAHRYEIEVGLYSYGCFDPQRVSARTRVGRYCSVAPSARIVNSNHLLGALTTHPYLYAPEFGITTVDAIDPEWLVIEDDVWIGHNATIMPGCRFIGRGAVIGAGAIVTRRVEPYTIVAGMPARLLRHRFAPDVIAAIERTRWWEGDKHHLRRLVSEHPAAVFTPNAEALAACR